MKIREERWVGGGFSGPRREVRVRELAEGEAVPSGAVEVAPETELHDWQPA